MASQYFRELCEAALEKLQDAPAELTEGDFEQLSFLSKSKIAEARAAKAKALAPPPDPIPPAPTDTAVPSPEMLARVALKHGRALKTVQAWMEKTTERNQERNTKIEALQARVAGLEAGIDRKWLRALEVRLHTLEAIAKSGPRNQGSRSRTQRRIIRDADGKIERVIEEPAAPAPNEAD